ncbi:putative collagen-binding domain-containing protein [Candidatus Mycolicibacterium alkanivorans]|uniref:Putative collagen-binding domain-containing protein n=1 Tax=Candidatus Mycolicibacterium alkanivorans TaxID=2954114 RepID=A0ABS9YTM1_9MYCO|nr:putative collagen-binding domain-containing protein [Candidatus Mycolicibacterium alkanivorans]MCI4674468.1 hypothetical protein [Candidatus Mycolicibacterium alkanivorans]
MGAPDQNIITSPIGTGSSRPQAISASDGSYAMVYSPDGGAFDADLSRLAGRTAKLSRFDPRTGTATDLGIVPTGLATYTAPTARLASEGLRPAVVGENLLLVRRSGTGLSQRWPGLMLMECFGRPRSLYVAM